MVESGSSRVRDFVSKHVVVTKAILKVLELLIHLVGTRATGW